MQETGAVSTSVPSLGNIALNVESVNNNVPNTVFRLAIRSLLMVALFAFADRPRTMIIQRCRTCRRCLDSFIC